MRIVIIKKATIILVICLLIVASAISLNATGLNLGAVYFNLSAKKKLPIYSVQTDENKVAISFDAAWGADKTREIMSVCDSYGVKATFFLVGFWVEEYPEMVKEIYNNGFEIGLHSNTHPDMAKLSENEMKLELTTNISLIENLTNCTPKLFRPPYGSYSDTLIDVCAELGLSCIQWDVDSLDWKGIDAATITNNILKKVDSGSIILCHNNADNIVEALKSVLPILKARGYTFVKVSDLLLKGEYSIDNTGRQISL